MRPPVVRRASSAATVFFLLVALFAAPASAGEPGVADRIGRLSVADSPDLADAGPAVSMPAGVLWTGDGRPLWERNADAERAMASTTKIMTAVVVLDEVSPDDTVVVSARAVTVGESEVDLVAGQRVTVRELLEAMLVHSGNDAAFALAEHVSGSTDEFVKLMNAKAKTLGMTHTSFANPHGLDAANHYTSAHDLGVLSVNAMSDPVFAEIVGEEQIVFRAATGAGATFENSNALLKTYSGATGIKTGWTNKAGYCVVASAERGPIELVAVVLGTKSEKDRFEQAAELLDWGFAHYAVRQLSSAEETAALVAVTDYLDVTIPAVVAETTSTPIFDLEGALVSRIDVLPEIEAPVAAGDRLGTLTVLQGDVVLAQVPIVAAHDVREPDVLRAIGIWFTRVWRSVFGGQLKAASVAVM